MRRKIFKQRELRQASYGTLKAAIVDNVACLVIVEIGMLAQLRERELVDVQLAYGLRAGAYTHLTLPTSELV